MRMAVYQPLALSGGLFGFLVEEADTDGLAEAGVNTLAVLVLAHVPAEIELGKVAVNVLAGDVMEVAIDTAFDEGKRAFHGVSGDLGAVTEIAHILAFTVVYGAVLIFILQIDVTAALVGMDVGAFGNMRQDHFTDVFGGDISNHHGAFAPTTLNERDNWDFVFHAFLVTSPEVLTAYKGFIYFDGASEWRAIKDAVRHGVADAVSHVPSALVLFESKIALELQGADALFAGAHEMKSYHPITQPDVGALKDGAKRDGERLAASRALIKAWARGLSFHGIGTRGTAVRTGAPASPANLFEVFAGLIFTEF